MTDGTCLEVQDMAPEESQKFLRFAVSTRHCEVEELTESAHNGAGCW